ncbi:hypothetical protein KM043_012667 [Ampulex compressa]|nr:hypothetical protein KM043_012667 [Ampulex compressa]
MICRSLDALLAAEPELLIFLNRFLLDRIELEERLEDLDIGFGEQRRFCRLSGKNCDDGHSSLCSRRGHSGFRPELSLVRRLAAREAFETVRVNERIQPLRE